MKRSQMPYSLVSFVLMNRGMGMERSSISSMKEREKEGNRKERD